MCVAEVSRSYNQVVALTHLCDHLGNELWRAIPVRAECQDNVAGQMRQDVEVGIADSTPTLFENLIAVFPAPLDGTVVRASIDYDQLVVPFRPTCGQADLDAVYLVQGQGQARY